MTKPPTSTRTVRLPGALWAKLSELAGGAVTVNSLVHVAVSRLVEQRKDLMPPRTEKRAPPPLDVEIKITASDDVLVESFGQRTEPLRMPRAPFGSRLKGAKK